MILYQLKWEDRNGRYEEWFGTANDLSKKRTAVRKRATRRSYDQIDIIAARRVDFPTDKQSLITYLNKNCNHGPDLTKAPGASF